MIDQANPKIELEIDGGVDATTGPLGAQAGANVLVAGSAVFGHPQGVAAGLATIRKSLK